jgi:hypothetical protein
MMAPARMDRRQLVASAARWALACGIVRPAAAQPPGPCTAGRPCVIALENEDLQAALDAAPPYATLLADKRREQVVDKTIRVNRPVTITGLRARLREKTGRTHLLEVFSEGVTIRDFSLTGNLASVPFGERASLIVLRKGRFVIENGEFLDSAKDGVMVTPLENGTDIEHGVIRDIVGRNNARDLVSIAGLGEHGRFVRHILVQNVRCYGSRDRGIAEASDGSELITFRDVYAESSFYGIDVQDHNRRGQINRHIVIDGLQVRNCITAVRTANHDFGHSGLQIRNVVGEAFRPDRTWSPVHIRNTRDVRLENIRISGPGDRPAVRVWNVNGLVARDLDVRDTGPVEAAVHLENVDGSLLENVTLAGSGQPDTAVRIRFSDGRAYHSLRVRNSLLGGARTAGLAVEKADKGGSLDTLVIEGIAGRVQVDMEPRIQRLDLIGTK